VKGTGAFSNAILSRMNKSYNSFADMGENITRHCADKPLDPGVSLHQEKR
jgi:hypothetical protein